MVYGYDEEYGLIKVDTDTIYLTKGENIVFKELFKKNRMTIIKKEEIYVFYLKICFQIGIKKALISLLKSIKKRTQNGAWKKYPCCWKKG